MEILNEIPITPLFWKLIAGTLLTFVGVYCSPIMWRYWKLRDEIDCEEYARMKSVSASLGKHVENMSLIIDRLNEIEKSLQELNLLTKNLVRDNFDVRDMILRGSYRPLRGGDNMEDLLNKLVERIEGSDRKPRVEKFSGDRYE